MSDHVLDFIHEVADALETKVIATATPGRWRPGDGRLAHDWSTLRTNTDDGEIFHLGTGIEKADQRAMMAAQPTVLAANVAVLRAADEHTPEPLTNALVDLCQYYNHTMNLRVDTTAIAAH